jgi:hypothetical protein
MPVMSGSTADGTGRNVGRRHGTTRRMLLHTRRRRDHPRGPVSVVAVSLWRRRSSSSIVVLSLRWRRLLSSRLLRLMVVVVVLHLDHLLPLCRTLHFTITSSPLISPRSVSAGSGLFMFVIRRNTALHAQIHFQISSCFPLDPVPVPVPPLFHVPSEFPLLLPSFLLVSFPSFLLRLELPSLLECALASVCLSLVYVLL